jgi:hypothetical protein
MNVSAKAFPTATLLTQKGAHIMNCGQPLSLLRTVLVFLLVVAAVVVTLLGVNSVVSSQQQDPSPGNPSPQGATARERKIGIGIPKHLPLKFEIRNLNSDRWVFDLEIDVTNTSTKPIYYLDFFITMPGYRNKTTGNKLGFWFRYGRIELVDFAEPLLPDDVPIAPGEKHTFKILESNAKGWDEQSKREGRPEPKVLNLQFQGLNFGDGTGFVTTAGEPVNMQRRPGGAGAAIQRRGPPSPRTSLSNSYLPAMFLPVNFSGNDVLNKALNNASAGLPFACGGQSNCNMTKRTFVTCGRTCDPNSTKLSQSTFGCETDPQCSCRIADFIEDTCIDPGSGLPLTCTNIALYPCCPECGAEGSGSTCSDGVDNDGDGFIDCQETECGIDPFCAPPCRQQGESCGILDTCCEGLFCISGACSQCMIEQCEAGCSWSCSLGRCVGSGCDSPVLVDVLGNGFKLTDPVRGANFDLNDDGTSERLSWTAESSDDAFLALDRNGNGVVDNGSELFGNYSPQPRPPDGRLRNGFLALAEFDNAANGGDQDGSLTSSDTVFLSLRLWQDKNHNGISEAGELRTLSEVGLTELDLNYETSRRTDQFGNRFRYRTKVKDGRNTRVGRWAWDVFLNVAQ